MTTPPPMPSHSLSQPLSLFFMVITALWNYPIVVVVAVVMCSLSVFTAMETPRETLLCIGIYP